MIAGRKMSDQFPKDDVLNDIKMVSDEESDDDSSQNEIVENELEKFRAIWKSELVKSKSNINPSQRQKISKRQENNSKQDEIKSTTNQANLEDEACRWFREGDALEQKGKLYEAVACYRRATQLVPDIEFRIYKSELQKHHDSSMENISFIKPSNSQNQNISNEEVNLIGKLIDLNIDEENNFFLCQPEKDQLQVHISQLPREVLTYILKWIVSNNLDMKSLEQFSMVCKCFYVIARDPEIWKLASIRMWGATNINEASMNIYANDWRKMYSLRPRLNTNGAYISRTTYVRHGEASFQDVSYRPCYLVEYYRYLRFFPDGIALMLTTPLEPPQCLPKLRFRRPKDQLVLQGHYRISGSQVSIVFKRTYLQDNENIKNRNKHKMFSEQKFDINLEIREFNGKKNHQLLWNLYSVNFSRNNGPEMISTFDLSPNNFPPFWYSRVKSFTAESESPLV